jgi:hypothetical protein
VDFQQERHFYVNSLPYPATKLVIFQCLYATYAPRFWACLIVGTFYDAEDNALWSIQIFSGRPCRGRDRSGNSPEEEEEVEEEADDIEREDFSDIEELTSRVPERAYSDNCKYTAAHSCSIA